MKRNIPTFRQFSRMNEQFKDDFSQSESPSRDSRTATISLGNGPGPVASIIVNSRYGEVANIQLDDTFQSGFGNDDEFDSQLWSSIYEILTALKVDNVIDRENEFNGGSLEEYARHIGL
jgi:hypothetical protein